MSLKLHLKPNEKIIIGGAVIKNGSHAVDFAVENNVTVLRQKDIMTEARAISPAQRVYFVLQLMYIDCGGEVDYSVPYKELEHAFIIAAPSSRSYFDEINRFIAEGRLYHALKTAQKLMDYELKLLNSARSGASVSSEP